MRAAPRRPIPRLTEGDRTAWSAYTRGVTALPGRAPPSCVRAVEATSPAEKFPVPIATPPRSHQAAPDVVIDKAPAGLDRATWGRFRTGRLAPASRLDLHGYTAEHAHAALAAFLQRARAGQIRCVEVVTGLGRGGDGVLRREVPLWLNLPPLRGMALAVAHPHGNAGAIRVLLRR